MAVVFTCPGCGKRFKVGDEKAGQKGKCPSCDTTFQIPAPAKARPAAEEDVFEDERDEPRRASASRRAPVEDTEDDDRDDFEEERPRKRRKKKKQSSSTGLILGLVGGALALLLVVGGVVWLIARSGGSTTAEDDLKYLPDNSPVVIVLNAEVLTASDLYKRIRQETTLLNNFDQGTFGDFAKDLEETQRVTLSGVPGDPTGVVVLRSKKVLSLNDIVAKSKLKLTQEEVFGRHTVRHDGFQGVAVVERKTAVSGSVLTLKKILERGGTKAALSPVLEPLFKELDFTKALAGAMDLPAASANQQAQPGGGFPFPQGGPNATAMPDTVTAHVELGASATVTVNLGCKNAQAAEEIKKQLDTFLAVVKGPIRLPVIPAEIADLLKNTQITVNDKKVSLSLTADTNTVVAAAKKINVGPQP